MPQSVRNCVTAITDIARPLVVIRAISLALTMVGWLTLASPLSAGKPACELITKSDVEFIMGFPFKGPQSRSVDNLLSDASLPNLITSSSCVFETALPETRSVQITARYVRDADPDSAKETVVRVLKSKTDSRPREVPGLGYPALFLSLNSSMYVFKGGPSESMLLQIAVVGAPSEASSRNPSIWLGELLDREKKIALRILGAPAELSKPAPTGGPSVAKKAGIPLDRLDQYNYPGIIAPLYSGDFDKIADDFMTRDYVISVAKGLNSECPKYANSADAVASGDADVVMGYGFYYEWKNLKQSVRSAFGNDIGTSAQSLVRVYKGGPHLIKEGIEDGTHFSRNQCDNPTTRQLYQKIVKLADERRDIPPDIPDDKQFKAQMNPKLQRVFGDAPFIGDPMGQPLKKACSVFVSGSRIPRRAEAWCRCQVTMMLQANIAKQDLEPLTIPPHFTEQALGQLSKRYPQYKGQGRVSEGGCYE